SFKFNYIDFKGGPMTALEQFINTTTIDMNFNSSDRTKVQQLSQNLSNIYNSMSGVAKAQVIAVNHAGIEKPLIL
ncbi:TPA: hypothetical protein ACHYWY_005535, partial [Escherichia coli]